MNSDILRLIRIALFVVIFGMVCPVLADGQTRCGASASLGSGLFVPAYEELYENSSNGLYPEVGVQIHYSQVQVSLKVGLVYRESDVADHRWDGAYYNIMGFDKIDFLPIQLELLTAPVRIGVLYPYAGMMVGIFTTI